MLDREVNNLMDDEEKLLVPQSDLGFSELGDARPQIGQDDMSIA